MLILSEFKIEFTLPAPTGMVALLHLHPSLEPRLRSGNELLVESLGVPFPPNTVVPATDYIDSFGNRCARFLAPAGHLRLSGSNVVEADSFPDVEYPDAAQMPVEDLPSEVLRFLLPSRYCEVDQFGAIAHSQFGSTRAGWERAVAIRDWVHEKVTFNYNAARPTKTSTDVFIERIGVCRDFQHLAITLTRCINIPARYVTGYIGDIRQPYSGPGDFSAWYQVFLEGQWINPTVTTFAKKMIIDHRALLAGAKPVALEASVTPPTSPSLSADAEYAKLKVLSGDTFDNSYIKTMVSDHHDDLNKVKAEHDSTQNESMKKLTAHAATVIAGHTEMIDGIAGKMGIQ